MTAFPEGIDPNHPDFIGPRETDPLDWRRREISRKIDDAYFITQLCDREESNFRVVARGISIPQEAREIVMTDQVRGLFEHVFAFVGIEQPADVFSPRGGKIAAKALRAYEDFKWIEFRQSLRQLSALDPAGRDEAE